VGKGGRDALHGRLGPAYEERELMTRDPGPLRVAIVAGTLARGGAEKQLVYMVRALKADGAIAA